MKKYLSLSALFALLIFASCEKSPSTPQTNSNGTVACYPASTNRIMVANQGTFLVGNGSLTGYDKLGKSVFDGMYSCVNSGLPLGDIVQSISKVDTSYYVVVNNSGKISVLNESNLLESASITGFTSPRFMLSVGGQKAYVSDLFGGAISVVDLSTNAVTGTIASAGWTEQMIMANGMVFVTQPSSTQMLVIDPNTDAVADSITVPNGAVGVQMGADGTLWVLCDGGWNVEAPAIVHIDPVTLDVVSTTIVGDITQSPGNLAISPDGQTLYFLNGGVMSVNVNQGTPAMMVASEGRTLYGLGVDPSSGDIYVSDAKDYVQAGHAYRYNASGTLQHNFPVGVVPGFFYFD